jgi:peptidoglycan/xylan/chitin deacetylase (PgdA/CDA1 family)
MTSSLHRALNLVGRSGALGLLERSFGAGGVVAWHAVAEDPLLPGIHISRAGFEEQLDFLRSIYQIVPLSEYVARRRAGRSLRRLVALTFDDAYTGVLDLALPLLERHRAPATVFVSSGYSSTGGRFWWDRIGWVARHAPADIVRRIAQQATGGTATAEHEVLLAMITRTGGRLTRAGDQALADAERTLPPLPLRPLDEAGLQQLARSSLIEFGCHTVSHPALPYIPEEEQAREFRQSTEWLEARLPRVGRVVAYPFGLYARSTLQAMRSAGMVAGFGLAGRPATSHTDLLAWSRLGLAQVTRTASLRMRLSWATIPLVALRNREWHPSLNGPALPPSSDVDRKGLT